MNKPEIKKNILINMIFKKINIIITKVTYMVTLDRMKEENFGTYSIEKEKER
jgi:hypothetical protein